MEEGSEAESGGVSLKGMEGCGQVVRNRVQGRSYFLGGGGRRDGRGCFFEGRMGRRSQIVRIDLQCG